MADPHRRELERREVEGDPDVLERLVVERLRTTELSGERAQIVALLLGEPVATTLGLEPLDVDEERFSWSWWRLLCSDLMDDRIVIAWAVDCAARWLREGAQGPADAVALARAWLECPCDRHAAEAGAVGDLGSAGRVLSGSIDAEEANSLARDAADCAAAYCARAAAGAGDPLCAASYNAAYVAGISRQAAAWEAVTSAREAGQEPAHTFERALEAEQREGEWQALRLIERILLGQSARG